MARPVDWWVLDLDSDPTPGSPPRVTDCGSKLLELAEDAERAERDVRALGSDSTVLSWIGLSGDAFREQIGELPDELRKLHTSYRMAGDALETYAPRLESAQSQADEALARGRAARSRLDAAQAQLGSAEDWVSRAAAAARDLDAKASDPQPPDEATVRSAVRNQQAAQARLSSLQSQVGDAEADLAAAKRLAEQARGLREEAAASCARSIDEASDAGIQNKPWWSWEKLSGFLAEAWDFLVAACKIVVAVLGIVVLIIGGPLAWVVLAAALVVLADTLRKYVQGKASLWDVAFAALDCIPGTKGLTTLGRLKSLAASGDLLSTTGRSLRTALSGMPGLAAHFANNAPAYLYRMTAQLVHGTPEALRSAAFAFNNASGWARLGDAWTAGRAGFSRGFNDFAARSPALQAAMWQGSGGYRGIDLWQNTTLAPGDIVAAGYPRWGGYVVPPDSLAAAAGDASRYNEGVQVGPYFGNYRDSVLHFQVHAEVPAASSTALANPQFGPGGFDQFYVPDIQQAVADGRMTPGVMGPSGFEPVRLDPDLSVTAADAHRLPTLSNTAAGPQVADPRAYAAQMDAAHEAYVRGGRGVAYTQPALAEWGTGSEDRR